MFALSILLLALPACSLTPQAVQLPDGRTGFAIENCRTEHECRYRAMTFCGHEHYGVLDKLEQVTEVHHSGLTLSENIKDTSRSSLWNWVIQCDPDRPIIDLRSAEQTKSH